MGRVTLKQMVEHLMDPEGSPYRECGHCDGYGSSLHEAADRCTECGGSGLVAEG